MSESNERFVVNMGGQEVETDFASLLAMETDGAVKPKLPGLIKIADGTYTFLLKEVKKEQIGENKTPCFSLVCEILDCTVRTDGDEDVQEFIGEEHMERIWLAKDLKRGVNQLLGVANLVFGVPLVEGKGLGRYVEEMTGRKLVGSIATNKAGFTNMDWQTATAVPAEQASSSINSLGSLGG